MGGGGGGSGGGGSSGGTDGWLGRAAPPIADLRRRSTLATRQVVCATISASAAPGWVGEVEMEEEATVLLMLLMLMLMPVAAAGGDAAAAVAL